MKFITAFFLLCSFALPALAQYPSQQVTVSGNQFFKDGIAWVPKGATVQALTCPDIPAFAQCSSVPLTHAATLINTGTFYQLKNSWGMDTVRFLVSQAAIDPQSNYFQQNYIAYLKRWVLYARSQGLVVILAMQWENGSLFPSWNGQLGYPFGDQGMNFNYSSTTRAWAVLAPIFGYDKGVIFELLNEPSIAYSSTLTYSQAWVDLLGSPGTTSPWNGYQPTIQVMRARGSKNVIMLMGLHTGHTFLNFPSPNPLVDPLNPTNPQFAYSVHTYEHNYNTSDSTSCYNYDPCYLQNSDFVTNFGNMAATYPMLITEFSAGTTENCYDGSDGNLAAGPYTQLLMTYTLAHSIGIIYWAFDWQNSIITQASNGTTYLGNSLIGFVSGSCLGSGNYGMGLMGQSYDLNNAVPGIQ